MHVVALAALATPLEETALVLARALGTTPYEERVNLAAGLPAIILTTPDPAAAEALAAHLHGRGDAALVCDTRDVVAASAMVAVRRFRLDDDDLVAATPAGEVRLPYASVVALIRARHRRRTEGITTTSGRVFALGRALATGGLVVTRTTGRTAQRTSDADDQVLYLFPRVGAVPWLLRETGTDYGALGAAMTPSSLSNFSATVEALRNRMPGCAYDERLLALRSVPQRVTHAGATRDRTVEVSSEAGVDLLAHLVARWLERGARSGGPYRG